MIEKFEIGKDYIIAAFVAGLAFIYRKTIKRFFLSTMDEDGDGKVKYLEWVRIPYLFLALFVVIREGLTIDVLFSDVKFIAVILCSLGVEFLMVWLKKTDISSRNLPKKEISSSEGEVEVK